MANRNSNKIFNKGWNLKKRNLFRTVFMEFLSRKNIVDILVKRLDIYEMLQVMIAERKNDLHFFSTSEPSDTYNLEPSMTGRHSVIHGFYDEISKHWISYLMAWIEVLRLVNAPISAAKVKCVLNELILKKNNPLEVQISSLSAPQFLSEENIPQLPGDMNKTEYIEATKIMVKMYRCVTKFLGPVLRDYNLRNRGQPRCDSEIDVQALLFDLLDDWHKNHRTQTNYQTDIANITTAKEGRNKVCHGEVFVILRNWKLYFVSWIDLCYLLNAKPAAENIAKIYTQLTSEK
ncbi:Uncharacterized protein APZ42_027893 [Daphnia magna]|uniref:Uncharacterized protein n=1 Tax=Daphnia magna TaxID=35525 RepID=A0A164QZB9_9CRUS|nr:Uncharacterized protein APZ42_027893 [Daphnia magna]